MSDERDTTYAQQESGAPRWMGLAVIALSAVSILGLGVAWNATTHVKGAEQALAAQGKTFQTFQGNVDTLNQRLAQSEELNTQLQGDLKLVTDKLKITQNDLNTARAQTKQIRSEYSKKLDGVQTELATKASADDLKSLGGDVNGVKTDLESTKNSLQMTKGEFGTLIARNHDEIEQLRRIGERDYYEFNLTRKGQRSKVGSVQLELRGTNTKKNQFTVAMYVDDMRLEKKNRSVDEPIYFYTRGVRAPLELVVNQISKDRVSGYVSAPKSQGTASASAASVN